VSVIHAEWVMNVAQAYFQLWILIKVVIFSGHLT
jgi:hypothetical protein